MQSAATENNNTHDDAVATTRKRKVDSLSRVANSGNPKGRGLFVSCPLCGEFSKKKYSLGRGIASHLQAIHTPWNPSKLALKIQRRRQERQARGRRKQGEPEDSSCVNNSEEQSTDPWEPSQQELEDWNTRVLQIIKEVEDNAKEQTVEVVNLDRTGRPAKSYKESLPPFLEAASRGDLESLQTMIQQATKENRLSDLIATKDRHMSSADHWAAGGGHLSCLKAILKLRQDHAANVQKPQKTRRRDGKTCLHYAARNGHLDCVKYLVEEADFTVDETSGEGTTPLMMACYGAHPKVARYLVSKGAKACASNEWGCTAAHWVGMTISTSNTDLRALCTFLLEQGLSFVNPQDQGHTALHKAALRRNEHVIQWLADASPCGGAGLSDCDLQKAGQADLGGHKPSAIWRAVGGGLDFAAWMESLGW